MSKSIAAKQARETERTQRRAELDGRDREHGGLVPGDRDREAAKRSMEGWQPYRTNLKASEVLRALDNPPDARIITVGRLLSDCRSATKRWAARFSKTDREAVATEAALCLLRWPNHGGNLYRAKDGTEQRSAFIDLGGALAERRAQRELKRSAPTPAIGVLAWLDHAETLLSVGTLPLRRDWIDSESKLPTDRAWRALHAAVKQACEDRRTIGTDKREDPTEGASIAELAELRRIEEGTPSQLPDSAAPEVLAEFLDCSLSAARAIVFQSFPTATPSDMAAQWGLSRQRAKQTISDGAKQVLAQWPNGADLLAALADAGAAYRTATEQSALLALIDYRDGIAELDRASAAVAAWRGASAGLSDSARALLAAARAASARNGRSYGAELAERIAASVPRLVHAEQLAARRRSRVRRTGALDHCAVAAQRVQRPHIASEDRAKLGAELEALARLIDSAAPDGQRVRELRESIAKLTDAAPVVLLAWQRMDLTDAQRRPVAHPATRSARRPGAMRIPAWPSAAVAGRAALPERRTERVALVTERADRAKHLAALAALQAHPLQVARLSA